MCLVGESIGVDVRELLQPQPFYRDVEVSSTLLSGVDKMRCAQLLLSLSRCTGPFPLWGLISLLLDLSNLRNLRTEVA